MASPFKKRNKVFISYSHQDVDWLRRLRVHLKPLEDEQQVEIWDDTKIGPGSRWREEIITAIDSAKVAILLVSADFLASDYIKDNELPPLLVAAEEEGAIILPVILSPSRFVRTASLSQFQAVNDPAKPLVGVSRNEQEAVLVKVSEVVEASLSTSREVGEEQTHGNESVGDSDSQVLRRLSGSSTWPGVKAQPEKERTSLARLKSHPILLASLVIAVAGLVVGFQRLLNSLSPTQANKPASYAGRVTDANSLKGIQGAKVIVETKGVPQILYTDADGIFNANLGTSTEPIRIRVETSGYATVDRYISISNVGVEDIRLAPVSSPDNSSVDGRGQSPSPSATPVRRSKDGVLKNDLRKANRILDSESPKKRY